MKVTADTNILARALLDDDPWQSRLARAALSSADLVAVTIPSLCELVWILARGYKIPADDISMAIRQLVNAANVAVDRPAVEAGLAMMDMGGDFADGVIAHQGSWLGAETFISFDRPAVNRLQAQGHSAQTPA